MRDPRLLARKLEESWGHIGTSGPHDGMLGGPLVGSCYLLTGWGAGGPVAPAPSGGRAALLASAHCSAARQLCLGLGLLPSPHPAGTPTFQGPLEPPAPACPDVRVAQSLTHGRPRRRGPACGVGEGGGGQTCRKAPAPGTPQRERVLCRGFLQVGPGWGGISAVHTHVPRLPSVSGSSTCPQHTGK